ncbi:MAG TPA: response regulator [Clostridiaceae bacterium]
MKKILIIDDTKSIRMMLTTCLELLGYEIIAVNNGYDGLDILEKQEIALTFLDIKMPELSGTEILKKIREEGIRTPVVIMTAYATVKNAIECTKLGVVAYLQKPFTADKVRGVLDDLNKADLDSLDYFIKTSQKLINENKSHEALNILKKALSLYIDSSEIYNLIGKAYESLGNKILAEKFYSISKEFI